MKRRLALAVLAFACLPVGFAPAPACARQQIFAITPGPLDTALNAYSKATGIQVLANPAVLRGKRSHGAKGSISEARALDLLLRGTGLVARRRGSTVLIVSAAQASAQKRALPPHESAEATRDARPLLAPVPPPLLTGAPIQVIGQRMADQRSVRAKTSARNIVDALSSDEVRHMPDATVVDAMRRLPGVSVIPVADNEHPRDVPIAPVVRGLTQAYNNVTIDGLPIASTGIPESGSNSASRGVRLDILPASLVSQLVVIKTFTPDLDPNAIGGAIDVQTRSPFDNAGRPFVSLEAGLALPSEHAMVQDQPALGRHVTATASTTFGSNGQFGLLVSGNYRRLANNSTVHGTSDSGYLVYYDAQGQRVEDDGETGNGIPVPEQDKYWINGSDRTQWGVSARLEANLDSLHLSVLAGDFHFRDGYIRNEVVIDPDADTVSDQTATSGHFDTSSIQVGYREGVTRTQTRLALLAAQWTPTGRDSLSLRAGATRATMREHYAMVKFTAGLSATSSSVTGSDALPVDYDTSALQYSFTVPLESYTDLSLYPAAYWRKRSRRANSDLDSLRLDWKHAMGEDDEGLGFATGLGAQLARYHYGYESETWKTTDRSITLADAGYVSSVSLPNNSAGLPLLVIDPTKAWALFDANQDSIYLASDPDDDLADLFTHRETILSSYGLARWKRGGWEVVGGVHINHTALRTDGYIEVDDTWSPSTANARYLEVLPSVLARFDAARDLRLRAAYSRTIGRPSYESYAPRSSVEFGSDSELGDADSSDVTVTLGNPDLKPRLSDNFDMSVEWTLPARLDGLVALAAFHKRIHHEIFDSVTTGYTYSGVYYRQALVSQPTNATAAHVSGLELSASVGSLALLDERLAAFGFSANWTLLHGAITVLDSNDDTRTIDRLVGQPSAIRNLSLFYSTAHVEVRGAMSWTGLALRSITPDYQAQDVYWAPRRQFDLQARYHFGPGFSAIFEVANLTRERLTSLTGPGHAWLKDSYSVPRTLRLSLHWGFGR